jgi:hypothetical protein
MTTKVPIKTEKRMNHDDVIDLQLFDRDVRLCHVHPNNFHNRPTVFDEIHDDTEHLIQNVVRPYIDPGCVNLTEEELTSECRVKIAHLFHNNKHITIRSRHEFFKYLKTALNNHVKGQVQRHRFTLKRTGIRPPDKGDFLAEHHKPVEISMDDPDSHMQVPEEISFDMDEELLKDFCSFLSPLEELVINQLCKPNKTTAIYSLIDLWSGRNSTTKISHTHMALGIGMDLGQFLLIRKQLQAKFKDFMATQTEDYQWNASVAYLATVYSVEVPRGMDKMVVRRLFSLAARNSLKNLTDEVKHHLGLIKARIPVDNGLGMSCFGVMYDEGNSKCMGCGHKSTCVVETRSLGLDKITPHPSILGRPVRIPVVNVHVEESGPSRERPRANHTPLPAIPNDDIVDERSMEIINFLDTNFKRAEQSRKDRSDEKIVSYALKGADVPKSPILWLDKNPDGSMSLRFTKPPEDVAAKLVKPTPNGMYLSPLTTAREAIKLIEAHANHKSKLGQ